MLDPFVEGVRSIVQVCQLVILAPAALAIVAARGRWPGVAGAIGGVVVGGWLFVTNRFGAITDLELRISAVVVLVAALALGLGAGLSQERPATTITRAVTSPTATWAIPALIGLIVVQWWRPCVGIELGTILTAAPDEPWRQLLPTIGFMLGISIPLFALGLIYMVWRPAPALARRVALVAAVLCAVLAASVLAGQHGEIVSRLFQWSQ